MLQRLASNVEGGPTYHRMCHYRPKPNDPTLYDVQLASEFVSLRVLEKIASRNFEYQDEVYFYLGGVSAGAALRGHLFGIKVHEILMRGGDIETQCIVDDQRLEKYFNIQRSGKFYFFDPKDLSSAALQTGPYHISRASAFKSIDPFYYSLVDDKKFCRKSLLFQIAVASSRPVQAKDIVEILESVGLLENAFKRPESVALIFVVPKSSTASKQSIPWDARAKDAEGVGIIPNIGEAKTTELAGINIETVGDLRRAIGGPQRSVFNGGLLAQCVSDFSKFDDRQVMTGKMLANIPQYVWET